MIIIVLSCSKGGVPVKKSVYLFIIWVVAVVLLGAASLVAPMLVSPYVITAFQRLMFICTVIMSLTMLAFIHSNAKMEQIKWLTVASTVLLVLFLIIYSLRLLYFFHAVDVI